MPPRRRAPQIAFGAADDESDRESVESFNSDDEEEEQEEDSEEESEEETHQQQKRRRRSSDAAVGSSGGGGAAGGGQGAAKRGKLALPLKKKGQDGSCHVCGRKGHTSGFMVSAPAASSWGACLCKRVAVAP